MKNLKELNCSVEKSSVNISTPNDSNKTIKNSFLNQNIKKKYQIINKECKDNENSNAQKKNKVSFIHFTENPLKDKKTENVGVRFEEINIIEQDKINNIDKKNYENIKMKKNLKKLENKNPKYERNEGEIIFLENYSNDINYL